MNLHQTHPQLYKTALLTLVQTAIGETGRLFDIGANIGVFADHNFISEVAEDVLQEELGSSFQSILSFTASYRDQQDEEQQRMVFILANDHQLALGFVGPEDIDEFLDDGEVEFHYGKNLFAYDALEIGHVAKIVREYTITGIEPDGNYSISTEDASESEE